MAVSAKALAARLLPRLADDSDFIDSLLGFMLDCMELYGWDGADQLYDGNRDFVIDFPNQDSRDQSEITLDAINRLHASLTDTSGAMILVGEESPDERMEAVRRELTDPIMHPEKIQQSLMNQRLQQQMAIEGASAQQQMQAAQAGAGQVAQQATSQQQAQAQQAQAQQAQVQAQQQGQPTLGPQQNAPASQPGVPNQAQAQVPADKVSAMMQNGQVSNRIIVGG
jgi:hypothetical protein